MQRKPSKCIEHVYWKRGYPCLCHESVGVHMHTFLTLNLTEDQWPASWLGWVDHRARLDVLCIVLLLYTRHHTTWVILTHAEFMFSLTTSNNFGQVDVILHIEIYCALNTGYVQIIFVYILLHTIPYVATLSVDLLGGNNVYDYSFLQYWLLLPCSQWTVKCVSHLAGHVTQHSQNGSHN